MTKEPSVKNVVLYAEDDMDDLQLVKDAFYQYTKNVELVSVSDGFQALSYLKNLPHHEPAPCLIILDINMPRMDGKEALQKIRQIDRFKEIPAILFTTSSQPLDRDFAGKYSAGFITKPIDFKQMEMIANEFIEHCTDEIKKKIRRQINGTQL
jgi:CheY-like chemotaxis protein